MVIWIEGELMIAYKPDKKNKYKRIKKPCMICKFEISTYCKHTYKRGSGCYQSCYNCLFSVPEICSCPKKYIMPKPCSSYIPMNYNPYQK